MERKILKASAGTGKTYRLSLEFAISLFKGEKIKNIIIMTFTRKATAEIKEDIIKFIKKLAVSPKSEEELKNREETIKAIFKIYPDLFTEQEIYLKAKKAYKEIILNRDNLKIFTIDGLKNNIFKTSIAPMLNINHYEIIDDRENEEYLKRCFEKLFKNKNEFRILKNFLENNVERNMEAYLLVIKNIIDDRWKSFLMEKKERELYDVDKNFNQIDNAFEIIEEITEKNEKNFIDYVNTTYKSYIDLKTKDEKQKFILNNWEKILKENIYNGSKIKGKKYLAEIEELLDLKESLNEQLSKIIYNENIVIYEKEILSFLERVYKIYDEIKIREKRLTQTDITNYTLKYINSSKLNLISADTMTSYMKDILESDITTVFIDEFQDTSIVQWKIFKEIITNAKKVICVGDEKQSIYGWRGGEKDLFINLSKILCANEETMDISYRSRKKIVDFTNKIFENFSLYSNMNNVKWDFKKVKSIDDKNEGYVYIYNGQDEDKNKKKELEKSKKKNSFEKIIEILKTKFYGNYKEICILARNNKLLNEMEGYLLENHIPYFIETNLSIFSHRTIEPVIKLMKYFIYNNIFYLIEFLRDNILEISDKSMKEILIFNNTFGKIENFSFSDDKLNILLKKIKKLNKKIIENPFENIDVIVEIIKDFEIVKIYNRESDIQNIYNFIELSKQFKNIRELLETIKEKQDLKEYQQTSMEVKNAITLMTIHKSKGLGYDTVFYLHKETNFKSETGVQFNVLMSKDFDSIKDYLVIDAKEEKILKFLDNQFDYENYKRIKKEEEEINNLYVALTRAKKNIFIFIENMKKDSILKKVVEENFISKNSFFYEDGILEVEKLEKEKEDINYLENPINFKIDFEKYSYVDDKIKENILKIQGDELKYSEERQEKRYIGNIIHFFLENIIYLKDDEIKKSKIKAISKYGAAFGKNKVLEILNSLALKEFLEKNKEIFSEEWDFIYSEYEIYSEIKNKLYRIDRLMIKMPKYYKNKVLEKGRILVVDYKTGSFEESQIENYVEVVKDKLPKKEDFIIEKAYLQILI